MRFDLQHFLVLVAIVPATIMAQGYLSTCENCSMENEELLCNCKDNSGQFVSTGQDLNICLANRGGSLVVRSMELPFLYSTLR